MQRAVTASVAIGVLAVVGGSVWYFMRRKDGAIDEVTVTQTKIPTTSVDVSKYILARPARGGDVKSVRNNNPGNLRYIVANPFTGQIKNDGGYGVYDTLLNGTRAAF